MITKKTSASIAFAYCEIEAAEELLKTLSEATSNREEPDFRDAFGRRHSSLQLGVPSGHGHRLFGVAPSLGEAVILAHVAQKRAEISALCEVARIELTEDQRQ